MESKLYLKTKRVKIDLTESIDVLTKIFLKLGCSNEVSQEVSTHLSDANLCGIRYSLSYLKVHIWLVDT